MPHRPWLLLSAALISPATLATTPPATPAPAKAASEKELPQITVIGSRKQQMEQPGSAQILDQRELESSRVRDVNEALRKIPGVNARDEEGFGMRPNIGIRGLNPTRSTKVLLLEDGIPATYAPYGDNASYYHAPIERYERIEVLKGSSMLRFGPQSVGGVINYITPTPREEFGGFASLSAGDHNYLNSHVQASGEGQLVDLMHKQGDGGRDNTEIGQTDLNYKGVVDINDEHAITLRANYLNEDSRVTYSGITDAELQNFGYDYNPFKNDRFFIDRFGASATHLWQLSDDLSFTTNLYGSLFERDWWRQSSTTTDPQCGYANARKAGNAVDPDSCNSIQGRLRDYHTWGLEPRMTLVNPLGELEAGVRYHEESQYRVQRNRTSSNWDSGSYTLAEKNDRTTEARAAFVQQRFDLGGLALIPVLRHEQIDYTRLDQRTGKKGDSELSEWIPGIGFTYELDYGLQLYGGVHKGFAPPRAEDVIDGSGGSVDVSAEESINREIGLRGEPVSGLELDLTWFSNDFHNQIAVGSVAGGTTPLAEGEARYEGTEVSAQLELANMLDHVTGEPYARLAWTMLPVAEQGDSFRKVTDGSVVGNSGPDQRMPYAPEDTATLRLGYRLSGWDAALEAVYVADQYSDFANTQDPVQGGDGQVGIIDSYTLYNLSVNYSFGEEQPTVFLAVKNLEDNEYITDRTRGIQTGNPRQAMLGVKMPF